MDKDRVEGKVNEVEGRIKRQTGEWTGNTNDQVEGGLKEIKGKVQNAWGKTKDAARDANDDLNDSGNDPHSDHAHSGRR